MFRISTQFAIVVLDNERVLNLNSDRDTPDLVTPLNARPCMALIL